MQREIPRGFVAGRTKISRKQSSQDTTRSQRGQHGVDSDLDEHGLPIGWKENRPKIPSEMLDHAHAGQLRSNLGDSIKQLNYSTLGATEKGSQDMLNGGQHDSQFDSGTDDSYDDDLRMISQAAKMHITGRSESPKQAGIGIDSSWNRQVDAEDSYAHHKARQSASRNRPGTKALRHHNYERSRTRSSQRHAHAESDDAIHLGSQSKGRSAGDNQSSGQINLSASDEEVLRSVFSTCGLNDRGRLEWKPLVDALKRAGLKPGTHRLQAAWSMMRPDSSGSIAFRDFKAILGSWLLGRGELPDPAISNASNMTDSQKNSICGRLFEFIASSMPSYAQTPESKLQVSPAVFYASMSMLFPDASALKLQSLWSTVAGGVSGYATKSAFVQALMNEHHDLLFGAWQLWKLVPNEVDQPQPQQNILFGAQSSFDAEPTSKHPLSKADSEITFITSDVDEAKEIVIDLTSAPKKRVAVNKFEAPKLVGKKASKRDRIRLHILVRWVNSLNALEGGEQLQPETALASMRDGVHFCRLIQHFEPNTQISLKMHKTPRTAKLAIKNIDLAIALVYSKSNRVKNVPTAESIYECDLSAWTRLMLEMVWVFEAKRWNLKAVKVLYWVDSALSSTGSSLSTDTIRPPHAALQFDMADGAVISLLLQRCAQTADADTRDRVKAILAKAKSGRYKTNAEVFCSLSNCIGLPSRMGPNEWVIEMSSEGTPWPWVILGDIYSAFRDAISVADDSASTSSSKKRGANAQASKITLGDGTISPRTIEGKQQRGATVEDGMTVDEGLFCQMARKQILAIKKQIENDKKELIRLQENLRSLKRTSQALAQRSSQYDSLNNRLTDTNKAAARLQQEIVKLDTSIRSAKDAFETHIELEKDLKAKVAQLPRPKREFISERKMLDMVASNFTSLLRNGKKKDSQDGRVRVKYWKETSQQLQQDNQVKRDRLGMLVQQLHSMTQSWHASSTRLEILQERLTGNSSLVRESKAQQRLQAVQKKLSDLQNSVNESEDRMLAKREEVIALNKENQKLRTDMENHSKGTGQKNDLKLSELEEAEAEFHHISKLLSVANEKIQGRHARLKDAKKINLDLKSQLTLIDQLAASSPSSNPDEPNLESEHLQISNRHEIDPFSDDEQEDEHMTQTPNDPKSAEDQPSLMSSSTFQVSDDSKQIIENSYTKGTIGAWLSTTAEGDVVIGGLLPGGAMEKNGKLMPGDRIVEVDGRSVEGLKLDRVTAMLQGPADSQCDIHVERLSREGNKQKLSAVLRRLNATDSIPAAPSASPPPATATQSLSVQPSKSGKHANLVQSVMKRIKSRSSPRY